MKSQLEQHIDFTRDGGPLCDNCHLYPGFHPGVDVLTEDMDLCCSCADRVCPVEKEFTEWYDTLINANNKPSGQSHESGSP